MVHGCAHDERNEARVAGEPPPPTTCAPQLWARSSRPLWRAPRARRASSALRVRERRLLRGQRHLPRSGPPGLDTNAINEVARTSGQRGEGSAVLRRSRRRHAQPVDRRRRRHYEPLESKPGDGADFNGGLTDGFTIELWLTPMDTDSSSDQVLVALEQREPAYLDRVRRDSDCPDNNCACKDGGKWIRPEHGQCFPGFEGTCDLLACTNAADGKIGFRLLQSKKNRGAATRASSRSSTSSRRTARRTATAFLCDYDVTVNPLWRRRRSASPRRECVRARPARGRQPADAAARRHLGQRRPRRARCGRPTALRRVRRRRAPGHSELDNTFKSAFDLPRPSCPRTCGRTSCSASAGRRWRARCRGAAPSTCSRCTARR